MWKTIGHQDKISELDAILSHIFLPMRDVVQTIVLSKRWNNLWISIPNLDLDEFKIPEINFRDFVDGVLSLHTSSNIQKCRLRSRGRRFHDKGEDYLSHNARWICDAITDNKIITEFYLVLFLSDDHCGHPRRLGELQLPVSFFTCKTLLALKVSSNCINLAPPPSA